MWLLTTCGFFSVVQKPEDGAPDTLTVRARVRADLDALRTRYLPELGETSVRIHSDYRYRATAPRAALAAAMSRIVEDLTYGNFKSAVALTQGRERADVYHDVWDVLYGLQTRAERREADK